MKFPRKILFVASVAACLVLAACGSDEKCVDPNSTTETAVPMYPSENPLPDGIAYDPNAILWNKSCDESMDSIEIPMSRDHIDISGTIATVTQKMEDDDTTVTVQFEGAPLPQIAVAIVQAAFWDEFDKKTVRTSTATLWKPGMEKAFTFSSKDFVHTNFSDVVLCVR